MCKTLETFNKDDISRLVSSSKLKGLNHCQSGHLPKESDMRFTEKLIETDDEEAIKQVILKRELPI